MEKVYGVRYSVEEWNKPIPKEETVEETGIPGIKVCASSYGFTDKLFVASIVCNEDGSISSILLMDSVGGGNPSREILEAVKAQIEHHLQHHSQKP